MDLTQLLRLGILLCSVFVGGSLALLAQAGSAKLTGKVTDPAGAALVGATVHAVNTATGVTFSTRSNEAGVWTLSSLSPGTYEVTVEMTGFAKSVRPDVELHVASEVALDFSLKLGTANETVTVNGGAPAVNTTESSLGGLVDNRQL